MTELAETKLRKVIDALIVALEAQARLLRAEIRRDIKK